MSLLENAFWFTKFLTHAKTLEQCKISESPPNNHCSINMMLIYKITEVNHCVSLREHLEVTISQNEAVAYMPCLGPHRKLILTAIVLKFSQINFEIIHIQKIEK